MKLLKKHLLLLDRFSVQSDLEQDYVILYSWINIKMSYIINISCFFLVSFMWLEIKHVPVLVQ